jgi:hypothetical protein
MIGDELIAISGNKINIERSFDMSIQVLGAHIPEGRAVLFPY